MKPLHSDYGYAMEPYAMEHLKTTRDLSIRIQDLLFSRQFCFMLIEPVTQQIVFSNKASQSLYQYTESELVSVPYYKLHTCPWGRVSSLFSISQLQRIKHYYSTHRRKNGTEIYVEVFFGPLEVEDKVLFYVFIRNLTEKREAEDKLIRSEKRHKLLFQNLHHPFVCVDYIPGFNEIESYQLTECNQAFEKLASRAQDVHSSTSIVSLLNALSHDIVPWDDYFSRILLGETIEPFEIVTKNASVQYSIVLYKIEENSLALIFEDITPRKKLEELRNDFINTLTHEIKIPLTSIKAGLDYLNIQPEPTLTIDNEVLSIIKHNADRLFMIVNDVLDLQCREHNFFAESFTCQSLNQVVLDVFKSITPLTNTKGLALNLELDPLIQDSYFYKNQIFRVLVNLLNNALKFTKEGSITLRTRLCEKEIEVCVRDTGIGISPQVQKNLFKPFYRGNQNNSVGTGLGLSISKAIIEKHAGRIWVNSELEVGSSFFFVFPYQLHVK